MFRVGDKVRALRHTPYTITTDGWTGYVTRVCGNTIWVSQQRTNLVDESNNFSVEACYFELVEPAPEKKKEEIKMYTVYDSKGIPYETVWNEIEADYIAYYIGGYYEENRRTSK